MSFQQHMFSQWKSSLFLLSTLLFINSILLSGNVGHETEATPFVFQTELVISVKDHPNLQVFDDPSFSSSIGKEIYAIALFRQNSFLIQQQIFEVLFEACRQKVLTFNRPVFFISKRILPINLDAPSDPIVS